MGILQPSWTVNGNTEHYWTLYLVQHNQLQATLYFIHTLVLGTYKFVESPPDLQYPQNHQQAIHCLNLLVTNAQVPNILCKLEKVMPTMEVCTCQRRLCLHEHAGHAHKHTHHNQCTWFIFLLFNFVTWDQTVWEYTDSDVYLVLIAEGETPTPPPPLCEYQHCPRVTNSALISDLSNGSRPGLVPSCLLLLVYLSAAASLCHPADVACISQTYS